MNGEHLRTDAALALQHAALAFARADAFAEGELYDAARRFAREHPRSIDPTPELDAGDCDPRDGLPYDGRP